MATVFGAYMSPLQRELEIISLQGNAELKRLETMEMIYESKLEADYLTAEAMVLENGGTEEDLCQYYIEAQNNNNKGNGGIISSIIGWIGRQFGRFGEWLTKVTANNRLDGMTEPAAADKEKVNVFQQACNIFRSVKDKLVGILQKILGFNEVSDDEVQRFGTVKGILAMAGGSALLQLFQNTWEKYFQKKPDNKGDMQATKDNYSVWAKTWNGIMDDVNKICKLIGDIVSKYPFGEKIVGGAQKVKAMADNAVQAGKDAKAAYVNSKAKPTGESVEEIIEESVDTTEYVVGNTYDGYVCESVTTVYENADGEVLALEAGGTAESHGGYAGNPVTKTTKRNGKITKTTRQPLKDGYTEVTRVELNDEGGVVGDEKVTYERPKGQAKTQPTQQPNQQGQQNQQQGQNNGQQGQNQTNTQQTNNQGQQNSQANTQGNDDEPDNATVGDQNAVDEKTKLTTKAIGNAHAIVKAITTFIKDVGSTIISGAKELFSWLPWVGNKTEGDNNNQGNQQQQDGNNQNANAGANGGNNNNGNTGNAQNGNAGDIPIQNANQPVKTEYESAHPEKSFFNLEDEDYAMITESMSQDDAITELDTLFEDF